MFSYSMTLLSNARSSRSPCFRIDPQHPAMKRAVTELQKRSPDTTFICLSNSNEIYIDTILKVSEDVSCVPSTNNAFRSVLIATPLLATCSTTA